MTKQEADILTMKLEVKAGAQKNEITRVQQARCEFISKIDAEISRLVELRDGYKQANAADNQLIKEINMKLTEEKIAVMELVEPVEKPEETSEENAEEGGGR